MNAVRTAAGAATLAVLLALTGCGSDDGAGADAESTSSPSQGATATPPAGGGFDEDQLDKIRECLDAAGLEEALPSDMPSDMPTDMPSDVDPQNLPEGFPSDGAQGQGDGLAALQDPEVRDALDACGIELPEPPTSPSS